MYHLVLIAASRIEGNRNGIVIDLVISADIIITIKSIQCGIVVKVVIRTSNYTFHLWLKC